MRKLLLAFGLLLALSVPAAAQCTGVFPGNYACGNSGANPGVPKPIPFTAIQGNITLTDSHILVGDTNDIAQDKAMSQDCTMANTGAITCLKTNNVPFGTAAVQDTGTSGPTIPFLDGVNTWSGLQTYMSGINLLGSSSGTVAIRAQATAGTPTITLPNTSGTVATTAASPLSLNATTGQLTTTTGTLSKTDDTNVTMTLGGTPADALFNSVSMTLGWTGTLSAARGGFGADVSASSGVPLFATGVPSFTSTTGTGNFVRATSPSVSGLTVTGSFTATGLVGNSSLTNPSTTVNGQTCTLGSTCTVTAAATNITINSTTLTGSTNGYILGANSGVIDNYSLSDLFDTNLSSTQGAIAYRGAATWLGLAPGTAGYVLTTGGAGTNPSWQPAGAGTVTSVGSGTGLTGGPITATGTLSVTGVLADLVGQSWAQGDIIYYDGTGLVRLPAGASGEVLKTNGAGADPSWAAIAGSGTVTSVSAGTGMSFSTITASGSVAIDKASASNFRAGTADKVLTADTVFTSEVTVTYGTTTSFDFSTFINASVTLTGDITTMNTSNIKAGQAGTIAFIQDGSGNHTTVWNSNFKFAGGTTPTLSTAANAVDILTYACRTTSFCTAILVKDVK